MSVVMIEDAVAPGDSVVVYPRRGCGIVRVRVHDEPRTAAVELDASGVRKLRKVLKRALKEIEAAGL